MTSDKDSENEKFILYAIPMILATLIFSIYHYSKLKREYLSGENVRRIFDSGTQGSALIATGAAGFLLHAGVALLYSLSSFTAFLTVPFAIWALNWSGKIQAYAYLGVVVDYDKGLVYFPPNPENIDIFEALKVVPFLKQMTAMDCVAIRDIERITRQSRKRVLMMGSFGSRYINFTDKLKRDECIHLLTAGRGRKNILMSELE